MDNNNGLVSIIVPVYNVEKYVERCIKSVIMQSYKNIEIILVNDGSTDGSGAICDLYKEKDNRIKVIHKENGGLSDARNCGIRNSEGKYLAFIDSDDYIHSDYIKRMMEEAVEGGSDIVLCSYRKVYLDGSYADCGAFSLSTDGKDVQNYLYNEKYNPEIFDVAWNKLYKKELFSEIWYPVGRIHEDCGTTYRILYRAEKIMVIPDILYYYVIRDGSLKQTLNVKEKMDWCQNEKERLEFYSKHGMKYLSERSMKSYYYDNVSCLRCRELSREDRRKYIAECKRLIKIIQNNPNYSVKEKLGVLWAQLRYAK